MPKAATAAEKRHLTIIAAMGCIACGGWFRPVDVHHITDCGRRLGHMFTLPLCPWHHRAIPEMDKTPKKMREIYGPSLAESKSAFVARYGTELELLEKVNNVMAH